MDNEFAPFELAVKLKEKGFREECFARYYCSDKAYFDRNSYHPNTGSVFYCYNNDEDLGRFYIDAPTISQVLKWLRKEKKIYIVIAVNPTLSTKDKIAYYYQVYSNSNGVTSDYYESEECYAQWEDCAIDSIKYVLDNLI